MNRETGKRILIDGMSCASCELLLERKLKALPGVTAVDVNHKTGIARIEADVMPEDELIAKTLQGAGYGLAGGSVPSPADAGKWKEIGGSLVVIFAVYQLLSAFDLVSLAPSTSGALSAGGVFLIGLVAGTSSCLAVTGGLLLALAARHNELHRAETPAQRFRPLLQFNAGRLLSYFILGGLVGVLGQTVTLGTKTTGAMNILVALVMLYLALGILRVTPAGSLPLRVPKRISRRIAALSDSDHPAAPFALGALTFFLPCGFTQSLQLAALASGSFAKGATIMLIFALGTLPALLGISAVSSMSKGAFSRIFLRFSGTLVLLLALFNLNSGLALTGVNLFPRNEGDGAQAVTNGGVQEISMKVTPYGTYEPDVITIKAGVPVRWSVDGTDTNGCTSILTIPGLNVWQPLKTGVNVIEFTAQQKGPLAFMCSMGMVQGTFNVI